MRFSHVQVLHTFFSVVCKRMDTPCKTLVGNSGSDGKKNCFGKSVVTNGILVESVYKEFKPD